MPLHPLASLFPSLHDEELARLVEDIRTNGLRHPIVEYQGSILDGRHRLRACQETGTPVRTEEYTGDDPVGFVLSANLYRRHLNEAQRAMIGQRL